MNPDDLKLKLGVLIIFTGKPDIPDGKSNGSPIIPFGKLQKYGL